ncbi:hypothetical protein [Streptomyces salinarius]|uniref:Rhodanese domain-containing protein n=1 Tax=Streptomyces salinarius TaxID=2762598 RepID=A0ABW8B2X2_9ACTN
MIDTVFPVHDIAAVHRRLESGGVRGKYVIDMRLAQAASFGRPYCPGAKTARPRRAPGEKGSPGGEQGR